MTPEELQESDDTLDRWRKSAARFIVFLSALFIGALLIFDDDRARSAVIFAGALIAIFATRGFVAQARVLPEPVMSSVMSGLTIAGAIAGLMLSRMFPP